MDVLLGLLKALSDRNRLRIISCVMVKPLRVCELSRVLNLHHSNLSRHLHVLRNAGLVEALQQGKKTLYSSKATVENADLLNIIDTLAQSDEQMLIDSTRLQELE